MAKKKMPMKLPMMSNQAPPMPPAGSKGKKPMVVIGVSVGKKPAGKGKKGC